MRSDNSQIYKEEDNRRNRLIAAVVTFCVCVVVTVVLLLAKISYQNFDEPDTPECEILFGGEYVMLGNYADNRLSVPAAAQSQESSEESYDMTDAGSSNSSSEIISTNEESEMQVMPREEKSGPTKEELEQIEKEKQRKEVQSKINKRVSFNSTGKSDGSAGVPNGKVDGSEITGSASFSLKGRSAEYFGMPSSGVDGKVVISVRVNPQGQVVQATYESGTGSAAASMSVRRSCEEASLKSKFNVARDITTDQIGTITWTFE